jgi:hypothetical protein
MVRWEHTCLLKDFGREGVINTKILNEALMLKWIWRIYNKED